MAGRVWLWLWFWLHDGRMRFALSRARVLAHGERTSQAQSSCRDSPTHPSLAFLPRVEPEVCVSQMSYSSSEPYRHCGCALDRALRAWRWPSDRLSLRHSATGGDGSSLLLLYGKQPVVPYLSSLSTYTSDTTTAKYIRNVQCFQAPLRVARETDGWGGLSRMNKIKMCASSLSREDNLLVRMLMLVAYFASSV